MKLLIIESAGKVDTIKKYLGKDWEVFATGGHIRDLPEKSLGVDIKNNFEPNYQNREDKENTIKRLQEKAKRASEIYIATDPDREGEAIGWHVATILGLDFDKKNRVEFNSITKEVVLSEIEKPRKLDKDMFDAQQARRVLDRLVGYKISPILCKKITNRLSAGRVQSVALKLVIVVRSALKLGFSFGFSNFAPRDQYSSGTKFKISLSLSTTSFSATLCTLPALNLFVIFLQRIGDIL